MAKTAVILLVLTTAVGVLAGPLGYFASNDACATSCPDDNSKFFYETGKTYEFTYKADVQTHVAGATQEVSGLFLGSTVKIDVYSACEMTMRLEDVTLEDANPASPFSREHVEKEREFKRVLEGKTLRFGFADGLVTGVCPDAEEAWALNIKKGILGSFQNTMQNLRTDEKVKEVDISGACPIEYKTQSGQGYGSRSIKKIKDVLSCEESHTQETVFHGIPYSSESQIQSLPIVKSTHECDQTVSDRGILTSTRCTEKHVLRPFSRDNSGATTDVTSELTFTSQARHAGRTLGPISTRTTLHFVEAQSDEEMEANFQAALRTLQEMCRTNSEDIRPEAPGLFRKLIQEMRLMDGNALVQLQKVAKNTCTKASPVFLDAMPMLMTAESIPAMRKFIERDIVDEQQAETWLTSLSFISRPTVPTISNAHSLLELTGPLLKKATLAVSSLVHSFCHLHQDCSNAPVVRDIAKVFQDNLKYNCQGETDSILLALKAVGNMGYLEMLTPTLDRCYNNQDLDTEIRVAAINAYRRMSCSADFSSLEQLFRSAEEDSEIRISAYLQLMRCASQQTVSMVKDVLESEQVNQVGSFVWTHLTNIQESSDPLKASLAAILEDVQLRDSFDMDKRKFSRNIEWSYFSEMLNTGAGMDANVIFSQQSFLPRSGSVNLTVDVFGQAYNVFELGGRVEGIQGLLEEFLQPETGRSKRGVNSAVVSSMVDTFKPRGDQPGTTQASYYMRMFGNELNYRDVRGFSLESLRGQMDYLTWLMKLAEQHDFEITKSMGFLDSEWSLPTSTGLPLKLSAQGLANMNLKVSGKMDIYRAVSNPPHIDIDGQIVPSAAVEVVSEMGVDAFYAKTGVKMVSTLHTSTHAQGKLQVKDGGFNIDVDMPKDKVEVLNVQSKFYLTYREDDREQQMLAGSPVTASKCLDFTSPLGVKMCADVSLALSSSPTAPMFPFTGPSSVQVYMDKTDTHTGYHAEGKLTQDQNTDQHTLTFVAKTPASSVDREFSADFTLDSRQNQVHLNARTPWNSASFDASLQNTDELKSLEISLDLGGKNKLSLNMEMPMSQQGQVQHYRPKLEMQLPGYDQIRIMSNVNYKPGRKLDWDAKARNFPGITQPIKSKGTITIVNNQQRNKYEVDVEMSTATFKGGIDGFIEMANGKYDVTSQLAVDYNLGQTKHRFTLNNKLKDQSTNTITQYSVDSQWSTTVWPRLSGDLSADISVGRNSFDANVNAGFDARRRVILKESISANLRGSEKTVDVSSKIDIPALNVEYEMTLNHKHTNLKATSVAKVSYAKGKDVTLTLNMEREDSQLFVGDADLTVDYPGTQWSFVEKITEKSAGIYEHAVTVKKNRDQVLTADSVLKVLDQYEFSTRGETSAYGAFQLSTLLKPHPQDVRLEASFTGLDHSFNGKLRHQYPQRRNVVSHLEFLLDDQGFTADVNGSVSQDLRQAAASISVRPAYNRWQPVQVSGEYSLANQKADASVILQRGQDSIVLAGDAVTNSDMTHNEINVRLTTPWRGWESTSAAFVGEVKEVSQGSSTGKLLMSKIEVAQGNKVISVTESFEWIPMEKAAWSWKFTSPFRGWEQLSASALLQKNGNTYTSDNEVKWGTNSKISLDISVTAAQDDYSGSLKLLMPFRPFDRLIITGSHVFSGDVWTTKGSVEYAVGKKAEVETQLGWGNNKKFLGATLTCEPCPYIGVSKFYTEFTGRVRAFTSKVQVSNTKLLDREIALTLDVNSQSMRDLSATATYSGPPGTSVTLKLTNTKQKRLFTTTLSYDRDNYQASIVNKLTLFEATNFQTETIIENNRGKKIEVNSKFKVGKGAEVTVDASTPFQGYESFALVIKHELIDDWKDALKDDWKDGDDWKEFKTTGALTMPSSREYKGSVEFTYTRQKVRAIVELEPPGRNSVVQIELVHEGTWPNIESTVTLTSGDKVSKVTLEVSKDNNQVTGEVKLESEVYEPLKYVGGKFTFYMQKETSLKTEFYWNQQDKIEAEFAFGGVAQGFDVSFSAKTPFEGYESMGASFNLNFGDKTVTTTEVYWSATKRVKLVTAFEMGIQKLETSMTLTTPFDKLSSLLLSLDHDGNFRQFSNVMKLEYNNNNKYSLTTDLTSSQKKFVKFSVDLETPFPKYATLHADYEHDFRQPQFKVVSNVQVGDQTGVLSVTGATGDDMRLSAELSTPFRKARHIRLTLNHDVKTKTNFRSEVTLEINNNQVYSGSFELAWFGQTFKVDVDASLPGYDKLTLVINHKGGWRNFENRLVVKPGTGERIKMDNTYKLTNQGQELSSKLETPYPGNFELSYKGEWSQNDVSFTAWVVTPFNEDKKWEATVSKSGAWDQFRAEFDVQTPIENFDQTKGDLTFRKVNDDYSAIGNLQIPFNGAKSFRWEASVKMPAALQYTGSLKVTTPFQGLEEWESNYSVKLPRRASDTTDVSLTIKTPLDSTSEIIARWTSTDTPQSGNYQQTVFFSMNKKAYSAVSSLKKEQGRWSLDYTVNSDFEYAKSMVFNVNLLASDISNGGLKLTYDGQQLVDMTIMLQVSEPYNLKLTVLKPLDFAITGQVALTNDEYSLDSSLTVSGDSYQLTGKWSSTESYQNRDTNFQATLTLPTGKEITVQTALTTAESSTAHNLLVQWDSSDAGRFGYDVELSRQSRRNRQTFDGKLKTFNPFYSIEGTVNHVVIDGRQFITTITIPKDDGTMVSKNELSITGDKSFLNSFTLKHPKLTKDISVTTEGTFDLARCHFEGKLDVTAERETLQFEGKIKDETEGRGESYTTYFKLAHPSTMTDVQFTGDWTNNAMKLGGSVELAYQMSQRRQTKILKSTVTYDRTRHQLVLTVETPVKTLRFTGGPTSDSDQVGVYRYMIEGRCDNVESKIEFGYNMADKSADATITIGDQMLKVDAVFVDYKTIKVEVYHQTRGTRTNDIIISSYDQGRGLLKGRLFLRPDIASDLKKYVKRQDLTSDLGETWQSTSRTIKDDLRYKAYLYQQTTVTNMEATARKLLGDRVVTVIARVTRVVYRILANWTETLCDALSYLAVAMYETMSDYMSMMRTIYLAFMDRYGPDRPLHRIVADHAQNIKDYTSDVAQKVRNHPALAPMFDAVLDFSPGQYLQAASAEYTAVAGQHSFKAVAGQHSFKAVVDVWGNLKKRSEIRQLGDALDSSKDYMKWAYDHYEVEDTVKDLASKTASYGLDKLKQSAMDRLGDSYQYEQNQVQTWNPEGGEVEVQVLVPDSITWDQWKEFIVGLMRMVVNIPNDMYSVSMPYMGLPSTHLGSYLPPFQATAGISGTTHYMTFDRKFYEFAGECSYVLAHDFIDSTFSLVVNYQRAGYGVTRKSLTLITNNRRLEVFSDGRLELDGSPAETPLYLDENTSVYRRGEVVQAVIRDEMNLECNLAYNHCTVQTSGWYFRKTGGLLGVYDYEPSSDFLQPDNTRTEQADVFARSWSSDRRCSNTNFAQANSFPQGSPAHDRCAQLFSYDRSPLQACFRYVDPAPFLQMCLDDASSANDVSDFYCTAASFYVKQCNVQKLAINVPQTCVKCNLPTGSTFNEGQKVTLEGSDVPKSADFVFVVEHADSGEEFMAQFTELVAALERSLIAQGLTDNRYGFVGYGGQHALSPHSHTMSGQLMVSARDMRVTFDLNSNHPADDLAALKMAALYPFRTGVAKNIVIVPQGECTPAAVSYSEVQSLLTDRDIRLHALLDHDYTFYRTKGGPSTTQLYGSDSDGIYTSKHMSGGSKESDSEIYRQVRLPKDLCAALSAESAGTVFSTGTLSNARRTEQRRFITMLGRGWASKSQPSARQQCDCVPNEAGRGVPVCSNLDREDVFLSFLRPDMY